MSVTHLLIYAPLLLPVLTVPLARPVADRLEPRAATWLLMLSALLLSSANPPSVRDF